MNGYNSAGMVHGHAYDVHSITQDSLDHSQSQDDASMAHLTAYERSQLNPLYFQQAAQATIQKRMEEYRRPNHRPMSFGEITALREGPARTIRDPQKQTLRKVRNGRMPANFWAPPSTIRGFGLDPDEQVHIAPTRRKRWRNEPNGFVVPKLETTPRDGYKRVIMWQDYTQDRVHESMGIKKQPIAYGTPMHGYVQAPIAYRPLTQAEKQNPLSRVLFENQF